jgi:hypothetical protein
MITMTYLLISSNDGDEEVQAYSPREMEELFSLSERLDLDCGKAVVKQGRLEALRYVDMVAAARQITN